MSLCAIINELFDDTHLVVELPISHKKMQKKLQYRLYKDNDTWQKCHRNFYVLFLSLFCYILLMAEITLKSALEISNILSYIQPT